MQKFEKRAHKMVSTNAMQQTVAHLCSLGEKVAGSPEEEKACNYITGKLTEYGISHEVHVFDSYVSYPRRTELTIHGEKDRIVLAVGVAFGLSTAATGITADLVFVGAGLPGDFVGKDLKGKIALVTKLPTPHNALAAASSGAIGMICMSAGQQRHKMIITPVWGTPEFDQTKTIPRIHVASISAEDCNVIIDELKAGSIRATIIADVFEGWRKLRLPVAEIKGQEDLFVLVGAHYCSWFDGSTDNVTGDACILELARILKSFEGKLRYGIRIAWWPGHSHGRYSGSTWYADTFWHDLYERGIVYFNIDSPGVKGATIYVPRHQMAEVGAFNEAVTKEVTGWDTVTSSNVQLAIGKRADKYVSPTRPTRAADQAFWGIGLSSMSVYSMLTPDDPNRDPNVGGSGGAWWWHSEHETIDKFDPEILAQDTRLYATIMLRLATAKVLPFCPSAIAQDFLDALREYDEAAGSLLNFKAVIAEAKALKTAMHVLEAQASNLSSPRATDAMNRQMLLLTRILNPALYQVGTSFSHDPALGSRALPSLGASLDLSALDPASDTARFAVVGLMRRLNQVTHQIREARKLVDEVIG
jgi:hypothetical protein